MTTDTQFNTIMRSVKTDTRLYTQKVLKKHQNKLLNARNISTKTQTKNSATNDARLSQGSNNDVAEHADHPLPEPCRNMLSKGPGFMLSPAANPKRLSNTAQLGLERTIAAIRYSKTFKKPPQPIDQQTAQGDNDTNSNFENVAGVEVDNADMAISIRTEELHQPPESLYRAAGTLDYLKIQPPKPADHDAENEISDLRMALTPILRKTRNWKAPPNHSPTELSSLKTVLQDWESVTIMPTDKTNRFCTVNTSTCEEKIADHLRSGWEEIALRSGWEEIALRSGWEEIALRSGWEEIALRSGWEEIALRSGWEEIALRSGWEEIALRSGWEEIALRSGWEEIALRSGWEEIALRSGWEEIALRSGWEEIALDPTQPYENAANELLTRALNDIGFDRNSYLATRLKCRHSSPPGLYPLGKDHKASFPDCKLRMVQPVKGSAIGRLDLITGKVLTQILPLLKYRVDSSQRFIEKCLSPWVRREESEGNGYGRHNKKREEGGNTTIHQLHLCSIDVESMYPTLPTSDTALDVLLTYLLQHQHNIDFLGFDPVHIIQFMKFIVTHSYATMGGRFYRQLFGMGTGYHSSGVYSEILVDFTYQKALNKTPVAQHSLYLATYVDDSISLWQQDTHAHNFLNRLNSIWPTMNFTSENAVNNQLRFLDAALTLSGHNISHELYQKLTHSGNYVSYTAHCEERIKWNIVRSETRRIISLCSDISLAWPHLDKLRRNLTK